MSSDEGWPKLHQSLTAVL